MNDAQIAELLRQRNPWWQDPNDWAKTDEKLRYAGEAPFEYFPDPLEDLNVGGLYTLTGPRRVGKSLEIRRKVRELIARGVDSRTILFCSCDGFTAQDLRRMFHVGRGLVRRDGGPLLWFVDEITAVDGDWSSVVKEARDNTELAGDLLVLTGSSARGLVSATKDFAGRRGPGRDHDRVLMPVGFRTFCRLSGSEVSAAVPNVAPANMHSESARNAFEELAFWTEDLHQAWLNFIRVGGFPQAVRELAATGDAVSFAGDLWDVIAGEALVSAGVSSAQIGGLLDTLTTGLTSPINASRIQRDLGFASHTAVYDRIFSLEQAYLVWMCFQDDRLRPNLRAQRKAYFTDPLLARALAHRNPAFAHPDPSHLVEQQIGLSLLRAIQAGEGRGLHPSELLMYRRTASKAEIDFVSRFMDVPIEVKYVDSGWSRAAQTLRANSGKGVVATRRTTELSEAVWAVPVANLAWLLDADPTRDAQQALPGLG